jgi:truncated hemoglobin YjbI
MPDDLTVSIGADDRFEQVLAELLLAEEAGKPLDLSHIMRTHPDLEAPLREYFRNRAGFDRLSPCLAPALAPTTPLSLPPDFAAGSQFASYEILGELGRGGMGVVYKARHVGLNRLVALKMILAGGHAGPDDLARFRGEAEAVARLKHPNVVQIYDIGEAGGLPYFSLEFVEGGSLERKLAGTPLQPNEAAALVETLARAMAAAHAAGLVHRDLKPANVLLTADGAPKVTDFGLVKKLDGAGPGQPAAGLTATGAILGTPSYMAPEQAGGRSKEIGPMCDIYALGAILYECLTGRPPFKAATRLDTILQVVTDEPVPPRQLNGRVHVDLETICLKCLMKESRRRYATAQELADDLRRYGEGRPIRARRVGAAERALKWVKRRPAVAAAMVGGVLLLFGAGAFLAAAWAGSKAAGEKAARDELDRFRAEVANERDQQRREEDERTRARQEAEARRHASRQLAKVAVLWDDYPQEALLLLEDTGVFPSELREAAWEGYHRLCRMDREALRGKGPPIRLLQTTADFKTLLTLDSEYTVKLWAWEGNTPQARHTLTLRKPALQGRLDGTVSMSADGTLLSYIDSESADRGIFCVLRDVKSNKDHPIRGGRPVLAPDGNMCALMNANGMELCDVMTGSVKWVGVGKGFNDHLSGPVFAPDGKTLAVESFVVEGRGLSFDSVRLYDVVSGRRLAEFAVRSDPLDPLDQRAVQSRLAFSPDGLFLSARLPPRRPLPGQKQQPPEVLVWDVPPEEHVHPKKPEEPTKTPGEKPEEPTKTPGEKPEEPTKPPAPGKTLWDRLGGEANIARVVDDFVETAALDTKVNFNRNGKYPLPEEKIKLLKKLLVELISANTGGPVKKYTGKDMKTVHEGMGITDAQFDALAADLKKALEKNGAKAEDAKALLDIVKKTRKDIVEKKEDKKDESKKDDDKGVRDQTELAKLPDTEREEWEKLWADVDALRLRAAERKVTYLDLQPQANCKLKDGEGNNLATLPTGEQAFADVKFKVGDGMILLGGSTEKVEGIKVGTTCRKLYFLHACHGNASPGAIIGYYTINYEDKSQEKIALVFGQNIGNWWYGPNEGAPSRATVAWEGTNDKAKSEGANIRLYMMTWNNPESEREVVSIDFGGRTWSSFCVAITAEK